MTEEIIIDGVNIAGCPDLKHYNDAEGNMMCMEYIDGSCEGHNCFFKQLKRLEQENKDLKNEINKLGKKHEDYCNTMYWQMKEQMDKYRSALEEIREIAKDIIENDVYENSDVKAEKILDKINEVLNEK